MPLKHPANPYCTTLRTPFHLLATSRKQSFHKPNKPPTFASSFVSYHS
nr:MAG TPA: hypothetical protein [Caudoviricetes sp.]